MKKKPVLFVTVGAPGSGKSYFAQKLCKEYGMVHLRSDEIREYVFPEPTYSWRENRQLFSLIDLLAEKCIAAKTSVIYDANFTKKAFRAKLQRIAKKHRAHYAVLWVQAPLAVAIKRAGARKYHPVDDKVVKGIHAQIESPKGEPVVIIDGTKPYKVQKLLIEKYLRG